MSDTAKMHNDLAPMRRLPTPPALVFGADGAPESATFADVYFSRAGGLAESEAVFLAGCGLPAGWAGRASFTVGELGFGTGLNLLAAWRMWRSTAPRGARLHFVSIEAHPMSREDARQALAAFPEAGDVAGRLLARWPVRAFGVQRIWLEEDVCLTLHVGEAADVLETMTARVDAWFLDGFAPARNPAMWTPEIMKRIAALSAPRARLATYSTAGGVRRGLEAAGFAVTRKPGFGQKRERLEGVLQSPPPPRAAWRNAPSAPPRTLAIVGGGIAGASLAAAARRRGMDAVVLDGAAGPGAGASGNPAALVMPRLDRDDTGLARLFLAAYLHAVQIYEAMGAPVWTPCGVVEVARAGREAAMADLLADPPLPPDWLQRDPDGMAHPRAGVVRPGLAVAALLADTPVRYGAMVGGLDRDREGWRLLDRDGRVLLRADAVVLANGPGLAQFQHAMPVPLEATLGQIEWGALSGVAGKAARAGGPYAAPFDQQLVFGATHERIAAGANAKTSSTARAENLAALSRLAPAWRASLNEAGLHSRAAVRAATPDRAPVCGPAPHAAAFAAMAAAFARDARWPDALALPRWPGLWLLGAMGGRGFSLAPLLAEAVISDMMSEPSPLDSRAALAVHPARFLLRGLRKSA